ncbi:hypothetical protein Efla_001215 [Eimeria flavescens]
MPSISAVSAASRGAPLGGPSRLAVPCGAPHWPSHQLQQARRRVTLSAVWQVLRDRLGGQQQTPGIRRGPPGAPLHSREQPAVPPPAVCEAPNELTSPTSEAVERHLKKVYKNPTPEELKAAKKRTSKDPVFFRQLSPNEFEDYRAESVALLADRKLCVVSPRQSAARELPLQTNLRTPLQEMLYKAFGRHREYPQIAWQMMHIILERVENEQLKKTFGIPEGFNGCFYLLILHVWLLHCRLCQQQKSQKSSFLADRFFPGGGPASAPAVSGWKRWKLLQQQEAPLSPQELKLALTRGVYFQRLQQIAAEEPRRSALETGDPGGSAGLLSGPHSGASEGLEASAAAAPAGAPPAGPLNQGGALDVEEERLRFALKAEAARSDISGEIISDYLFQQTWGLVTDWLRLKKVGQFQLQAELKNCQAYAFGFMVSLDQALTETDVFPARLKEALWGNVYSGDVGFGDRGLTLLIKYTVRQLLHVLQLDSRHFFQARFSWADFPLSPNFLAPPLLPPLSLPVTFGGFAPKPSLPSDPLLGQSAARSRLITK